MTFGNAIGLVRGSITTKPQLAKKTGSTHLRPNGTECSYFGSPPLCMKCGALLDPIPHAPGCDPKDCSCEAT